MPLLPVVDSQTLEDHFFGSGAFMFGWFSPEDPKTGKTANHFPVRIVEWDDFDFVSSKVFTEQDFLEGIKKYAETLSDRSFQDLIEDMDAADVDNVIQLMYFGEILYS